jgi:hypothetical protein
VELVLAELHLVSAVLGQEHLVADLQQRRTDGSGSENYGCEMGDLATMPAPAQRHRAQGRSKRCLRRQRPNSSHGERTLTFMGSTLPSRVMAPGPTATICSNTAERSRHRWGRDRGAGEIRDRNGGRTPEPRADEPAHSKKKNAPRPHSTSCRCRGGRCRWQSAQRNAHGSIQRD